MPIDRRLLLLGLGAFVSGCASGGRGPQGPSQTSAAGRVERVDALDFSDIGFSAWNDDEPQYVLYPGDEIEIATPTASELTRTQRIGPDGRISLPLVGQIMAADRTIAELEADCADAYASQLRRPLVEVTLKTAGPMKVWVDGEVRTPNVYDMPGDIDVYQAVIMAGGALPSGRLGEVGLMRRGPDGTRMLRSVDLRPNRHEIVALRRGDIIYVPRTRLAEIANWVTQFRNALPVGFTYALGNQRQNF